MDFSAADLLDQTFFSPADLAADAERAPSEPNHALRVLESISDGVLILNRAGTCEFANPAAAQLLGWSREHLTGINVHDLVHPAHQDRCLFDQPLHDALPVTAAHDLFATGRGYALPVRVSVVPSITEGVVDSVVCSFSDATAHLRRERARAELMSAQQAAVVRLEELAAQQKDFVSTVSHELRTPLTSIMGFLDLLGEDPDLNEDHRETLGIIERNARRLLAQVEALLLVSRIEAGKIAGALQPVDLQTLIEEAVDAVRVQATDKGIDLMVDVPADLAPALGDPAHLDRALLNLLSNAVKFTPRGGSVSIEVTQARRWVHVQVSDTGMGVPAAEQHRLFEKFFRSTISQKKATPGTGLGLAIVKAIVEEHGGRVAVTSEEGVGTAVAFSLPLSAPEQPPTDRPASEHDVPAPGVWVTSR